MMRPYPTIDDQIGGFLDTMLQRQADHWNRTEPLTASTVMGAVNLSDELARLSVEGEQSEDSPISERNAA